MRSSGQPSGVIREPVKRSAGVLAVIRFVILSGVRCRSADFSGQSFASSTAAGYPVRACLIALSFQAISGRFRFVAVRMGKRSSGRRGAILGHSEQENGSRKAAETVATVAVCRSGRLLGP